MNLDNKKVLVTGADGFIGSHLTEALVYRVSADVAISIGDHTGVSVPKTECYLFNAEGTALSATR